MQGAGLCPGRAASLESLIKGIGKERLDHSQEVRRSASIVFSFLSAHSYEWLR